MKTPMNKLDFAKLRKKYPKMHLHYYDNGAWTLTSKKPPEDLDAESDEFIALVIAEGEDYNDCDGYLPDLVRDLAKALGITSDTI